MGTLYDMTEVFLWKQERTLEDRAADEAAGQSVADYAARMKASSEGRKFMDGKGSDNLAPLDLPPAS